MVSIFYDYINVEPELINSNELINQLSVIEKRSNGSISAKHGHHDDLFMASCLCAYTKKKTIAEPKYSSIDKINIDKIDKEETMLINNILITDKRNFNDNRNNNIFQDELELLKFDIEDDDFVF